MKKLWALLLVLSMFAATGNLVAGADSRDNYESYVAAYNAYRSAVDERKPTAEILQLLETYQKAKASYEGTLNKEQKYEQAPATPAGAATVSDSSQNINVSEEAIISAAQKQLPTGLKRILEQLWSTEGQKNPDKIMKLLASYADSSANAQFADLARYELAKAYELLKDDSKTATTILSQVGRSNPNSRLALLAKERVNYLANGQKYQQWKQAINSSYDISQQSYQKYRQTSWLAIPVKATRWIGYASKLISFNGTKDDFEKFQLYYEEMGAKFAPPVEITFDRFKPATESVKQNSELQLCYSNSKSWYSRWKIMEEARESINIQYFIMSEDIFGYSMLGMLLKKANEGLKIKLLLDARGTKKLTRKLMGQDLLQELVTFPNVDIKVFSPVHANLLTTIFEPRTILESNHDKIIVVDNEYVIVGGRNVSMDYFLEPEDHPAAYRDCDVIVKDTEIATQLDRAFDEEFSKLKSYEIAKELFGNWDSMADQLTSAYDVMNTHLCNERLTLPAKASKKYLNNAQKFLSEVSGYKNLRSLSGFDPLGESLTAPAKIIDKNSLGGPRDDITDQMIKYIDGCKQEVNIQNPYVVLTDRMFAALKRASKRGIPIFMHTNSPASTDSLATQAMFYSDWKRIFKEIPNMRIFVYKSANKLHAKNWVFDKKIGVVGTYNLDYMSEQINSEVVLAVKSAEFSKQLRDSIFEDIAISAEYKGSVNEKGEVEAEFGPDDLPGKNFWLLKTLSKFTIFKKFI